ncbi:MAG: energy-coupling factor ABC transporter permease, partial [Kiritimatiellaeota bacterium]|nr:energy-coupling factor ABC transporter permease [Kiritimatiellota bacterium]
SVLLGPYAGLLVISSILVVQALFFADGGLLALGCNIFNMGVIPCLLAYPLIYKPLTAGRRANGKIWFASVASSVAALTLGASCVVLETCFSGISALPFSRFLLLMLPADASHSYRDRNN